MNTTVEAPDSAKRCTIDDVVAALKSQKIAAHHDQQDWGDWIILEDSETVISIESIRGLTTTATIEHAENEAKGLSNRLFAAFHKLGWEGIGEDGPYRLG